MISPPLCADDGAWEDGAGGSCDGGGGSEIEEDDGGRPFVGVESGGCADELDAFMVAAPPGPVVGADE